MKMLSFGEILWDVYPSSKAIGGASLNLAAHAALLGNDAYLATAIGDDELGKEALEVARKLKINDKFIFTLSDKETGAVIVTLNEKGIPSYEIKDNVAYDFIKNGYGLTGTGFASILGVIFKVFCSHGAVFITD